MNSPAAASIHGVVSELAERGTINIRRAHGNWKLANRWEAKLHPVAIQPIQQFAYTKGKNAIDMAMDAMDLLYTEKVEGLAASGNLPRGILRRRRLGVHGQDRALHRQQRQAEPEELRLRPLVGPDPRHGVLRLDRAGRAPRVLQAQGARASGVAVSQRA
jgi:hypothetical protein